MRAILPPFLLGVVTVWAGTFMAGATFQGSVTTHLLLLASWVLGIEAWRDPLRLGRRGRWLLPALVVAIAASWIFGPVRRAGLVGLLLLLPFLFMPAAVASCWRTGEDRRIGLAATGALFGAVAAISLGLWWEQASPRAAMPLGHHNLLAIWLLLVWPIALVGLASRRAWRPWLALSSILGLVALSGTGSFLAVVAFLLQSLIAAVWWKPVRGWLLTAAILLVVGPSLAGKVAVWRDGYESARPAGSASAEGTGSEEGARIRGEGPVPGGRGQGPSIPAIANRAGRVLSGADSSTRARSVYYTAGWEGLKRRPLSGWGPGSVPFTIAEFTQPVAGLNPPGEIIGDLHSLPLHLAYEIGLAGLVTALAVGFIFVVRRTRELRSARDPRVLQAALIGLAGGGVMSLGNAQLSILAFPVTFAVVAGSALSAVGGGRGDGRRVTKAVAVVYVLLAIFLLAPLEYGHFSYQRAVSAESPEVALDELRRAVEWDPDFALYRARYAWLSAELDNDRVFPAEEALAAAKSGYGVAALWLAAGTLGLDAGRSWAEGALERAVALDPLSPIAAFHLVRANPGRRDAIELGARAVSAAPRLGGALWWEWHPDLRDAVAERLPDARRPGFSRRSRTETDSTGLLVESLDLRAATSFSLFAFRRSPWPANLAPVEVRVDG